MSHIPEDYEPVEDRIRAFYADHPTGRIVPSPPLVLTDEVAVFRVEVYREIDPDPLPASAGHARGLLIREKSFEKCETVAVGRALANLGYAKQGARPSAEEMETFADEQAATAASRPAPASPPPPPPKPAVVRSQPSEPVVDEWTTDAAVQAVMEAMPGSEVISEQRRSGATSTARQGAATPKQLGFLKRLLKDNDPSVVDDDTALTAVNAILTTDLGLGPVDALEDLNKSTASGIIDAVKAVAG